MASQPSDSKKKKQKKPKKRVREDSELLEHLDSLPWNSSLPETDDAFSHLFGDDELGGGFLSLEEVDETTYGLEISKSSGGNEQPKSKGKPKTKKQKISESHDDSNGEEGDDKADEEIQQKKKKRSKKKKGSLVNKTEENTELTAVSNNKNDDEEDSVDETEFYAWNEMRLHPLLMKSIYRLNFKEPTPIQRACIPAAAHQGKVDVVGAAETGSGKTLAFGLPILQRLLEEKEKADRLNAEDGEVDEKIAPRGLLRALIVTPTRELALQVTDHIREVAKHTNIRVIAIVGGMSTEKQERLLKRRPEIVVGTPGRLWELMSGGEVHLVELHSLSFFVLDEADRMIETGHFQELQSIVDMLPMASRSTDGHSIETQNCITVSSVQRKKRQTFVFSATISLSADFRKKLKRGSQISKSNDELNSIETLSERAGMRADAAIVDLTNASIMANKLMESFIECREEDKDGYLYYILSVHGKGRTIVSCTSVAALRHLSSMLRILGINVSTLHAQMQQRARLKPEALIFPVFELLFITSFHIQLRSGRTARAFSDGCSIALISSNDASKFASLCKSFAKESFQRFPVEISYMPEVMKRLSLARQIDKILRERLSDKANKTWLERHAESVELELDDDDSEEERVKSFKQKRATSSQLKNLQQELKSLLSLPLQPKTFSNRFLAGAGVSPLLQNQLEELAGRIVWNLSRHFEVLVQRYFCLSICV
nr:DEAD-box ATP-dependent RNA helicase 13 [Ipomoea batatas]